MRRCAWRSASDGAGLVWQWEDDGVDTRGLRHSVRQQVAEGSFRWLSYVEMAIAPTLASTWSNSVA